MRQVLRAVLDCLPVAPRVKRFVADFERGLWQAIRSVFRSPQVRGCNFHWAQSVWRKVQELGLQVFTVLLLVRRCIGLLLCTLTFEFATAVFFRILSNCMQAIATHFNTNNLLMCVGSVQLT